MTCISRPRPVSESSSCTSSSRHWLPLIAYSLWPVLKSRRLIVTSAYSIGSAPSLLSMVRVTSARPSAGLTAVPAKTTSSILPPRSDLTPCWPITHENASTTLDLPEPFGPTTQVMPGSNRSVVTEAKDLKPRSVRVFRYTACSPHQPVLASQSLPGSPEHYRATRGVLTVEAPGTTVLGDLGHSVRSARCEIARTRTAKRRTCRQPATIDGVAFLRAVRVLLSRE